MWSLGSHERFAAFQAMAGAHDVIEDDELGEGQGVALTLDVTDIETAQVLQAIGTEVAGFLHVEPDAIFKFTGFLVRDSAIDLQYIAHRPSIYFFGETQCRSGAILRNF